MRMINTLASPTYNSSPELFLCMVFTQVGLFVRHAFENLIAPTIRCSRTVVLGFIDECAAARHK